MRKEVVLFFLVLLSSNIAAIDFDLRGFKYPLTSKDLQLNTALNWSANSYNTQTFLKEVKYYIITGNFEQAKLLLNNKELDIEFTKQIRNRYLATIYFIDGKYEETIKVLSRPNMLEFTHLAKTCFLKILSYIILEKISLAKKHWPYCREATYPYSSTRLTWMQTIVDLKTTDDENYIKNYFKNIKVDELDGEILRIYLKMSLYLNQQDKITPRFNLFNRSVLEDVALRELIGLNYYRSGKLQKAYQILEELETANAEVFKGNIYLHQKKFEQSFAQFKLALKRKSNSANALERLLPLSWKLAQYKQGIGYLNNLIVTGKEKIEHLSVLSVFSVLDKNYEQSDLYLRKISKMTNKIDPVEVSQVRTLTNLKRKNFVEILDSATASCFGNDGVNCWFIMALGSWESLTEVIGIDQKIHKGLKSLREIYSQKLENTPIKETLLIDQKMIEELDNELISL